MVNHHHHQPPTEVKKILWWRSNQRNNHHNQQPRTKKKLTKTPNTTGFSNDFFHIEKKDCHFWLFKHKNPMVNVCSKCNGKFFQNVTHTCVQLVFFYSRKTKKKKKNLRLQHVNQRWQETILPINFKKSKKQKTFSIASSPQFHLTHMTHTQTDTICVCFSMNFPTFISVFNG